MKGINIAIQIECACGALVDNIKQDTSRAPTLCTFVSVCDCGRKYFTSTQESKKHDKPNA